MLEKIIIKKWNSVLTPKEHPLQKKGARHLWVTVLWILWMFNIGVFVLEDEEDEDEDED